MFRLLARPLRSPTFAPALRRTMAATPDYVRVAFSARFRTSLTRTPVLRRWLLYNAVTAQGAVRAPRRDRPRGAEHHRQGDMAAVLRPRAHRVRGMCIPLNAFASEVLIWRART